MWAWQKGRRWRAEANVGWWCGGAGMTHAGRRNSHNKFCKLLPGACPNRTVKQSNKLEKKWGRRWGTGGRFLDERRRLSLQRMKILCFASIMLVRGEQTGGIARQCSCWVGRKGWSLVRLELWWKGWMKAQVVTCCAGSWQPAGPSGNAPWWVSDTGHSFVVGSLSLAGMVVIPFCNAMNSCISQSSFFKERIPCNFWNFESVQFTHCSEQVLSAHFCKDKKIFVLLHPNIEL